MTDIYGLSIGENKALLSWRFVYWKCRSFKKAIFRTFIKPIYKQKISIKGAAHTLYLMLTTHTNTYTAGQFAYRGQLHFKLLDMYMSEAPKPWLQGSILRSILQHCKLMIQQIPSVLLPLSLPVCYCPLSLPLWSPAALQKWETTEGNSSAGAALFLWCTPLINKAAC